MPESTPSPSPEPAPAAAPASRALARTEPLHGPEAREPTLRVDPAPTVAGGLGAITSTLKHTRTMGLVRGSRLLLQVNQDGGFDCPGCAWPDPDDRSAFEFCENGAKAVAEEAMLARCGPDFFAAHPLDALRAQTDRWLGTRGRLTHPMILREGSDRYEPLAWDEAFALIGETLRGLDSPDEALFYTSGRTSNEAAFLYQLFVRGLGTNNLPDCSNMCHESSGKGLGEAVGIGKGTVRLSDFEHADAIFVIGQNPGTNHPRMLTALQAAARRGASIVSINPLAEAGLHRFKHPQEVTRLIGRGTPLAALHLPVKIGGDIAALKGLAKVGFEREAANPGTVLDRAFIAEHTDGFEAFEADIEATGWDAIVAGSGLTRAELAEAADVFWGAKAVIATWAMGLTQHKFGVGNIQMVVNLLLMGGHMGREGAGACPVRGHSNVQGDRTMGIWEAPPEAFLDRLGAHFAFEPPRAHGHHTVGAIEAMAEGRAKVFFAMGGNFYSAAPDSELTARALQQTELTVHVSTKLNRSHLLPGRTSVILPCLGRTERDVQASGPQFVTVENSMGVVHRSQGAAAPASEHLRSEPAIVAGLAQATFQGPGRWPSVDWQAMADDYDRVRDAIAAVIPGFEAMNARVRQPGGFELPNGARDRDFKTATQKARFRVHPIPSIPLAEGELLMMTIRSHDQYNTTIYGPDDRYRGIRGGRRVVLMHADDLEALGLRERQRVDLSSTFEGETRWARGFETVPYAIPRGCCATYFPEANPLVPIRSVAERSFTPTSKSVVIRLHPVDETHP